MMKWKKMSTPISDEAMAEVEKQLGVKLPQDFVEWTQQFEGPESDHVWVDVNDEAQDVEGFLGPKSIIYDANLFFEDGDKKYREFGIAVPFAVDSIASKYFLFYPKGSESPSGIYFKSSDVDNSAVFDENGIRSELFISNTFQGFLDQLYHYDPFED
ncbi:SMI1-KNR4 cell-wall [Marininema mesophilum]|uniref:SMI1-KNR4 cell-wall n=1 Tax=Marininema mesophilum TaxID=1048340 RepID=A0A1H2YJY4_9BACL|nr:SMI1/KNR4 family protein [Marininema mesophilum]SDX04934.1 SMI1-KNR4 cell-wall [Marininema mesophilum]